MSKVPDTSRKPAGGFATVASENSMYVQNQQDTKGFVTGLHGGFQLDGVFPDYNLRACIYRRRINTGLGKYFP